MNIQDNVFFSSEGVNNCSKRNNKLYALMQDRGYRTITDFAHDLNVSRSRISQIVNGLIEPSKALKIDIAKKLNTDSRIIFPEINHNTHLKGEASASPSSPKDKGVENE